MPVNSWNSKKKNKIQYLKKKYIFDIINAIECFTATNELHFWIISTDYKNYAIAWSCDVLCPGWNRRNNDN